MASAVQDPIMLTEQPIMNQRYSEQSLWETLEDHDVYVLSCGQSQKVDSCPSVSVQNHSLHGQERLRRHIS